MESDKIFYISWKGTESGPYSANNIRDMLETGKIGYLHFVRTRTSKWIALKDANLAELACATKTVVSQKRRENDFLTILLYVVAGLAFLSPWFFLVSISLAAWSRSNGDKFNATISLILSGSIAICGLLFFGFIYPTVSK